MLIADIKWNCAIMTETRQFLSIPEAAALMGVSRIAVFKKVKKGRLAAIRIGRNWAIPATALSKPESPPPRRTPAPPVRKYSTPENAPASRVPHAAENAAPQTDPLDDMGWD
jgi:excisionase family DNA binding protein